MPSIIREHLYRMKKRDCQLMAVSFFLKHKNCFLKNVNEIGKNIQIVHYLEVI